MYKSEILKVTDVELIQKDPQLPLYIGDVVQKLNPEKGPGKERLVGPPMRVVQIAGTHLIANYRDEPV